MSRSPARLVVALAAAVVAVVACKKAGPPAGTSADAVAVIDAGVFDPDAGPIVRFVAIGDTGKGNDGQRQVGKAIGEYCAANACDFVVLLGDNFYPSGVSSTDDAQWQSAFVEPYAPVNVPFYAVLGNHDCGGDGAGTDLPKGDVQVAYSQVNPKWRMPARHYTWSLHDVDFFVADTNRSMFDLDEDARKAFATWLPDSKATWKIAFGHHPLKSNGPHGNAGSYDGLPFVPVANGAGVRRFLEESVCGRADLYLCGHDHNLQWLKEGCTRDGSSTTTELLVSGAGAAPTRLIGTNPTWYQSDAIGFVTVVIQGRRLVATFYDGSGTARFSREVTK